MIKVLLVDDEPFIRQGLRVLVNWESYGYEIVGEAENGEEAIRVLGEVGADLLMVDVRMPGMSGMELISYVQEHISREIEFVILTGYADFSYAKKAIGLQVREYMLKPVQREELIRVLQELKEEFVQKRKKMEQEKRIERMEYDTCIAHMLWGKYTESERDYVEHRLCPELNWRYVSFEFDRRKQEIRSLNQEECRRLEDRCMDYLSEILKEEELHVVPSMEREEHIFGVGLLLTPRLALERDMQPREWIVWLRKRLCQYFCLEVQAYVGEEVEHLDEIAESYHSIRAIRCLRNFSMEKEAITEYGQHRKKAIFPMLDGMDELIRLVKENQRDELEAAVGHMFEQIRDSAKSIEVLSANIYYLLYRLLELARELDDEANQEEILQYIGQESFEQIALSGDCSQLTRFVRDYAAYLEQLRQMETGGITEKVIQYVQEHYKEKLSLKGLGERFYINNVYLGQLFKKRQGISFKEYLNQVRMEEATRLLTKTDMRIYAIAQEVGFANVDYFINKFMQLKGMTPFQYRKKTRGEEKR